MRVPAIAVALLVTAAGCKKEAAKHSEDSSPAAAAPTPPPDAAETSKTLGTRCTLDGEALATTCLPGASNGIALDKTGRLFVVAGLHVRRYKRVDSDTGCHYAPDGAPIDLPEYTQPKTENASTATWQLVTSAARDAVYAWDFMGGLVRVDGVGPAPEPACNVNTFFGIAGKGSDLLVTKDAKVQRLVLGKKCKAVPAPFEGEAKYRLEVVDDVLYNINGNTDIVRFDGKKGTPFAETKDLCFINGLVSCGDRGICAIDSNCPRLYQFAADGKLTRKFEVEQLFADRPYSIDDATRRDDGTLLITARWRTEKDKDSCENSVYAVAPTVFAP